MKRLSTKAVEKIYDSGKPIFVRWSRGPRFDRKPSRDYLNGGYHAGISSVKIGTWAGAYLEKRMNEYRFLMMKDNLIKPYIYAGEQVGLDSDGYELINPETAICLGRWVGPKMI